MSVNTDELSRKLGIKPNVTAYTLHAPDNYLNELSVPISIKKINNLKDNIDWIQVFYENYQPAKDEIAFLKPKIDQMGQLWISWPKKTSNISSNLSDTTIRQIGLDNGLVDVKVASINETWSGLKFVYRLADRKA